MVILERVSTQRTSLLYISADDWSLEQQKIIKGLVRTRSAGRKKAVMGKRRTSCCSVKAYTDSGELGTMKTNNDFSVHRFFSKNLVRKDEIECGVSNSVFLK